MSPLSLLLPAAITALSVTAAPPMLPFTELSDKKIETVLEHMLKADECTPMDMNVVMQLDHIHWKYAQMREVFYKTARDSADGATVNAKDLGKMFDKIDSLLDADRERILQRIREDIEKNGADAARGGGKPRGNA